MALLHNWATGDDEPWQDVLNDAYHQGLDALDDPDPPHPTGDEMDINSMFPSKWIKAADLRGQRVLVTIDRVEMQTVGEERKAVVYFVGREKGLVLNRTNSNALIEICGSADTDDWEGQQCVLYPTRVDFQGKRTDAVRIDAPPKKAAKAKRQPEPEPKPEVEETEDFDAGDADEPVPF